MKLIAALVAASSLLVVTPASAKVEIKEIAFNPKGADDGSNRHLNKEYVFLKNTGSRTKDLSGWKLHDKGRNHVYRFDDLRLHPGDTVTLRTGQGDDGAAVCEGGCPVFYYLHWGLEHYVWNNGGDVAMLKTPSGKVVDRCRYGSSASSPKRC